MSLAKSPKKNWPLFAGGCMLTYASNLSIQKWGSNWPTWAVCGLYAVGLLWCAIAIFRYERFLKEAGVKFRSQLQMHPVSFVLVLSLVAMGVWSIAQTIESRSRANATLVTKTLATTTPASLPATTPKVAPPTEATPSKESSPKASRAQPAPRSVRSGPVCVDSASSNCAQVNNGTQTVTNVTKQSLVDNEGEIGSLTLNNSFITGTPPPGSPNDTRVKVFPRAHVSDLHLSDTHMCNLSGWKSFLDCINSESGDAKSVEESVQVYRSALDSKLNSEPDKYHKWFAACRTAYYGIFQEVLLNASDERKTVAKLRTEKPVCIGP